MENEFSACKQKKSYKRKYKNNYDTSQINSSVMGLQMCLKAFLLFYKVTMSKRDKIKNDVQFRKPKRAKKSLKERTSRRQHWTCFHKKRKNTSVFKRMHELFIFI